MSESLPKYMLLDQNNEEIRDKRIMPDAVYEQVGERATMTKKKKICNTIPLGVKLGNSSSIHNIEYSSKYGVLLLATDNEVVVKTTDELQADLIAQKQNFKGSMSISFSGELFLSPDEEIVAICSESLMQFVKTSNLGNPNNIEVPPIPNLKEANHYLWVDNTHFLCWKFQGTATLYTIDPKTLNLIGEEEELEMKKVTGASVIHQHLFLISKMIIKIYEPLTGKAKVKSEIDMTDPHHDSPYFQYSCIIDVFKINIKEEKFTEKDVFGFVVVFYDVDDDASDERFLTFARGDIFNRQSLEIRGYENFYSTKTSKELFYNDDQEKLSFSVKRIVSSGFICIMLEKSEKLYVVDPLEEFDRLNVYDIKSKHQLKNQEGKFLQGMALMRNMLKIQRSMPKEGDELLREIVKKYNGEFMNLYFKDKETSLTIAFPVSILAVGGDKFYKRYAISSVDGIEDENNQQIFERLAKMKRSPHILQAEECKKIGEKSSKKEEPVKIIQVEKKEEKKEVEKKQQAPKEEPKKEEKKQESAKTASDLFKGSSMFGNTPSNIFGKPASTDSAPKTGASLFGNPTADGSKPLFPGVPSLFEKAEKAENTTPSAPSTGASIFNKPVNPSPNPTTAHPNPQPSIGGGSLLDKSANSNTTSLFGAAMNLQANETTSQAGSSFFGNSGSSIFGNSSGPAPKLSDLIKGNPNNDSKDEIKVNILGAVAQKKEEKSLFPALEKIAVEDKPKAPLVAKKEEKTPDVQAKKQETSVTSLFSAPANSLFGGLTNQQAKPVTQTTQPPAKKPTVLTNQGFFSKPAENNTMSLSAKAEQAAIKKSSESVKKEPTPAFSVPKAGSEDKKSTPSPLPTKKEEKESDKPETKSQETEQKSNRSFILKNIHNKLNNFMDWQKKTFTQPSQNPKPTDYLSIKKDCERQQSTLRGIKANFFGQDVQQMAKLVSDSTQNTQNLIVSLINHDESTEEDLQRRLTDYEEVSNKMLYYVNLLGRKKVNMRASLTQSQMIDKGLNNLNRLIRENEEKIEEFDQGSEEIMKRITVIDERKRSSRVKNEKKGKKYNFQMDEDEEHADRKIRKSYIFAEKNETPKLEIKYTVVQLSDVSQAPIIKLPEFEKRPVNPPKKAESQPFSSRQTTGFGQPQPQSQQPKPKPAASPTSFVDKIPVKTEKVHVPIVPKVEPKKEEEKQAISQVFEQSQISEDELQPPQAKRQISSIQQLDIRGLKPKGTQTKPKKEESNNKAPESAPKAQPIKGGLTVPQTEEGTMLFSQTTSIFDKSSASIGNSLFANTMPKKAETAAKPAQNKTGGSMFAQPAAKPKEQEKEKEKAPTQSTAPVFGLSAASPAPVGSLFGNKNPLKASTESFSAPKAQQKPLAPTQPKTQQPKPQETKPEIKPAEAKNEPQSKQAEQKKEAPSLNSLFSNLAVKKDIEKKPENIFPAPPAKSNITSPAFTAFPNSNNSLGNGGNIFGASSSGQQASLLSISKKPEPEPVPATQPQETKEQPKSAETPVQPDATQAVVPPKAETKSPAFTDAQAQSNNNTQPSSISPSNSNSNLNSQQPQTTNANQNNPSNTNTAFMGTSFGNNSFNQPAPQFGGGNNRFMNSNPSQSATTGFNPNTAKFGGFTSNNQKSFGSIGGDGGNMFQGNSNNQQQTNPLANQSNVFNQNNQNANTNSFNMFNNNANNNLAGNNKGGNLFNANNNNSNNNAFNTNTFANSSNNNAPTSVFGANTNNAFNNNNAFGANNNTAFGANNNNANNVFGGNNNKAFGGNNSFGQSNSTSNLNTNPSNPFPNTSNNNSNIFTNNNANNNTSMFGNTSNINNANFLSKLNANNPIAPPVAVNPHLLQMRK